MRFDELIEDLMERKNLKHINSSSELSQLVYKDAGYAEVAIKAAKNLGAPDYSDPHDAVQWIRNVENETGNDATDEINYAVDRINK